MNEKTTLFNRALGERIKEAREQAQVTQDQLAEAVELSRTSITNIERGRQGVQVYMLVSIARTLGKDLIDLIPKDDITQPISLEELRKKTPDKRSRDWAARIIGVAQKEVSNGT